MLKEGKKAPDFTLENQDGNEVNLSNFFKKNIVLYFYPKDDTPGCTKEACGFRDTLSTMNGNNAIILGVSPDDPESHSDFITKYGLPFQLLSDVEKEVAEEYGVLDDDGNIKRSTFLIAKGGKLIKTWYDVKVDGHIDDILDAVKDL